MRWAALVLVVASSCTGGAPPPPPPTLASARAPEPAPAEAGKEDIDPEGATGMRHGMRSKSGSQQMVGAANPHASKAGQEILRAGGSAVDAAIAIAMVLSLVEPQSSGIGGGAFLLHYEEKSQKVAAYDGRERAPAAATPDMFLDKAGKPRGFYDAVIGGLSVGVPGELRMLELAHQAHGKLPWKRLFEPAIRLAEAGFAISPRLHGLVKKDRHLGRLKRARAYFLDAAGAAKKVGTVVKNPELAKVLRAVADGGADAFYTGALAKDIADAAAKAERNPGRLTAEDMADYAAVERKATCRPYRKYRVCGMPPPTSGGITTLQILGLLERFDLSANEAGSVADVHLFAEAGKLAYADRDTFIGDPDFVRVPTAGMLSPAYLAKRSKLIDPKKAMGKAVAGDVPGFNLSLAADDTDGRPSTSHIVVVDSDGDAVSMTASIEGAFGSHVMVHGFLLNNELTDFSFTPEKDGQKIQNRVQPKKRPRSSMAPIIVLDEAGKLHMVVGSPGGSRIIGYVARVLIAVLDHGQDVQTAIGAPNFLNRNGATELEKIEGAEAWLDKTKPGLSALGHQLKIGTLNSGIQAIMVTEKGLVGGADPRREGLILAD